MLLESAALRALALCLLLLCFAAPAFSQTKRRTYPRFFPGKRWSIAFGAYTGVEKFAVDEIQRIAQVSFPYVIGVEPASAIDPKDPEHLILVGTEQNNPLLRQLIESGKLAKPTGPQGYSIAAFDSPWKPGCRVIALVGYDAAGVLYGVEEFLAQITKGPITREQFDSIPDFARRDAPAIGYRGIWGWGYVIYDYRRFFDNMARLKLNTITIWNDVVPLNCADVIAYAHSRGIRVILGFQWGYDIAGLDPTSAAHRKALKAEVVAEYKTHYRKLGMDGIYFQTFTENSNLTIGAKTTAAWACEWVNDISSAIYKLDPHERIEFGLHASSIRERFPDLRPLDPRIVITWEDAGTLPFAYDPVTPSAKEYEATLAYAKSIASFRPNTEFAMVAKGWIQLPWQTSEHHGPYIQGERDPAFIRNRLHERQPRWDFVNALWIKNYPLAARFYREVLGEPSATACVTGLIDDGMFEEHIQPSVALFAQTLWNPWSSDADLLSRAASPYYGR